MQQRCQVSILFKSGVAVEIECDWAMTDKDEAGRLVGIRWAGQAADMTCEYLDLTEVVCVTKVAVPALVVN